MKFRQTSECCPRCHLVLGTNAADEPRLKAEPLAAPIARHQILDEGDDDSRFSRCAPTLVAARSSLKLGMIVFKTQHSSEKLKSVPSEGRMRRMLASVSALCANGYGCARR
jgi:hypothetical protein